MNNFRKAYVYLLDKYAGLLEETDEGYSFKYDETYLKDNANPPISLTMPLKDSSYKTNILFPFFDNLIPEGYLLNLVVNNWKIDRNDRFSLLLVTAKDPIGKVTIKEVKDDE